MALEESASGGGVFRDENFIRRHSQAGKMEEERRRRQEDSFLNGVFHLLKKRQGEGARGMNVEKDEVGVFLRLRDGKIEREK